MDFQVIFTKPNLLFLLDGLLVTLEVALLAIVFSFVFGTILGILRYTKIPVLSHLAILYIEVIRNIPFLLVIFFGYFGLKQLDIDLPITTSVIISMTIFTSSLIAEIVRSGLNSVDRGQTEAARAQGLSYIQTLWHIIMPQGFKRTIPPMVSQFVSLIKDTSLAVAISLPELTHNAQIIYNKNFNATIPLLLTVAVIYFVINYGLSQLSRKLEKVLSVY
ncbi:amino acid ABC transporter permease [Shimazuella alba]|uniref:ABC transporter permease subunit n=1 Tax=Shimazuella alba TaxID=2690964 RepID=A0A6I4VYV8_9BACL|nr:amino acid ABC transporter permease [Shimazuella alba]MXQ55708.1 ABC transporter permease subunit [Shimazuella alba]